MSPSLRPRLLLALCSLTLAPLAACGDSPAKLESLFLRVSSEAPAGGERLDSLRILLSRDGVRYPARASEPTFNPTLVGGLDPTSAPVIIALEYDGSTFAGPDAILQITGRAAGVPLTAFEGPITLTDRRIIDVHLRALPVGCDADGDGFLDCSTAGCCESASVFADCGPADAEVNPWATEPACEPCDDLVDQDCSGADQACVDEDSDGIADCAEVDCGAGDGAVGPGLSEICDGKDNDCDGDTDEGLSFIFDGQSLGLGDACGRGLCAGGQVECDDHGGLRCSTWALQRESEDCATADDDNCDGSVNEGCGDDLDGDGFVGTEGATNQDCNDYDAGVYPGAPEGCCDPSLSGAEALAACDANCDGSTTPCEAGDADHDGYTAEEGDCDDDDASIYPGAPERCGDGLDQDCFAGDLACAGVIDADGDGWPEDVDCDDDEAEVHPWADERCDGVDDDCDGQIDEGNPDSTGHCDGSSEGLCDPGTPVCVNLNEGAAHIECVGEVTPADERCDGEDNDCDGFADEDFVYGAGEAAIGDPCDGVGACGEGSVVCTADGESATCSTNPNGTEPEVSEEVCDDLDNDCDGETNEGLDDIVAAGCSELGVCGAQRDAIHSRCDPTGAWICDYAAVPGYQHGAEQLCDDLDNDCDGDTDEDFHVGDNCDGDDADDCAAGTIVCTADQSGATCEEAPDSTTLEVCDGLDNDCDGETDEDFKVGGAVSFDGGPYDQDAGKHLDDPCGVGVCAGGVVVCAPGGAGLTCSGLSQASDELCDAADNDCDGDTDEDFKAGGTLGFDGGPYDQDAGKHLGDSCGTGPCGGGAVVCDASGVGLTCDSLDQAGAEVCDHQDNDCDGDTDEDFKAGGLFSYDGGPNPGDAGKHLGDSCGVGACGGGAVVCDTPDSMTCDTLEAATVEVCDATDNDCDGALNEGLGLAESTCTSEGVCGADHDAIVATCTDLGAWECDYSAVAGYEADEVSCDGADNDCDSATDEGSPDQDGDDLADCVDPDIDGDGVGDDVNGMGVGTTCAGGAKTDCDDNCPLVGNPTQTDFDGDGVGNVCDDDLDGDSIPQEGGDAPCDTDQSVGCDDNCPTAANADQRDTDDDGEGDVCDDNDDGDAIADDGSGSGVAGDDPCIGGNTIACDDNCPLAPNDNQEDQDLDGIGDVCDPCTDLDGDGWGRAGTDLTGCAKAEADCDDGASPTMGSNDLDGDNLCANADGQGAAGDDPCGPGEASGCDDNCPDHANPTQADADGDGLGDLCDPCNDVDVDGYGSLLPEAAVAMSCPLDCDDTPENLSDTDGDNLCVGLGQDACAGGVKVGCEDNCPDAPNAGQRDQDGDAIGDKCDPCTDVDGDGRGRVIVDAVVTRTCDEDCDDTQGNHSDDDDDNVCVGTGQDTCTGGLAVGCEDNCPGETNADQADLDGDEVGDQCDPCTDVDGDGFGRAVAGVTMTCDLDCDDALDNESDKDADNICVSDLAACSGGVNTGCSDNCPDNKNADQSDLDGDATGDVCDTCTDADGDGWGDADLDRSGCDQAPSDLSAADCDDVVGNQSDQDRDNVCVNTGLSPCTGGAHSGCEDNCPGDDNSTRNPDQADLDGDGVGDLCDPCPSGTPPTEVCGDCLDNDCDGATDEAGCSYRRIIAVDTNTAVPAGFAVRLLFDHAELVAAGLSTASGDDARLYWHDPSTYQYTEIDLVLDPESSWDDSRTTVWFATQAPIPADSVDTDYELDFGVSGGAPRRDGANVFTWYDAFERADSATVGGGWSETEAPPTAFTELSGGALTFTTDQDAILRPYVQAALPEALSSGVWRWRLGFDWVRPPGANNDRSRVLMQLGQASDMLPLSDQDSEIFPNDGVGVSLLWGGEGADLIAESTLGAETPLGVLSTATISGPTDIEVIIDFHEDDPLQDPEYSIVVNNLQYMPVDFSTPAAALDAVRLVADQIPSDYLGEAFDYTLIRPGVRTGYEPMVYFGVKEPVACEMSASDQLVVQYWLDDSLDDPAGAGTNTVSDSAATPLDMTRHTDGTTPEWVAWGGNHALQWADTVPGDGLTSVTATGTKVQDSIREERQITAELVIESNSVVSGEASYFLNYEDQSHKIRFALIAPDDGQLEFIYNDGQTGGAWEVDLVGAGRAVYHLVWDTIEAAGSRVRLYRDGRLVPRVVGTPEPPWGTSINGNHTELLLGNRRDPLVSGSGAPFGWIYYAALYSGALSDDQIVSNASVLLRDDDRNPAP